MAETESLLKEHILEAVYLLENMGFVINHPKSGLVPTHRVPIISTKMEIKLPGEKLGKSRVKQAKSYRIA